MSKSMISSPVIKRLPRYYRFLGELEKQGVVRISSRELSLRMGLTASQIRQDLNCFGGFGQQGYGYNVKELYEAIGKIIGISDNTKTIIIGAGNLGSAIAMHIDFSKAGFRLMGIFDINPDKIGLSVAGITVADISSIESFCKRIKPECAVLCIPKDSAPETVDRLINLGIKAFWNFSHYDINVEDGEGVLVQNVHLSDSLMTLSYGLHNYKK